MNYLERIMLRSPWWSEENWEQDDRSLKQARSAGFLFRHLSAEQLRLENLPPGRISIIRGPRQVGKTTELKLLVKDLISAGIKPRCIGYYPCDDIIHFRELIDLIRAFVKTLRAQGNYGFLLLDEVTMVKDWARAIKPLADSGELERVYLLITGSSAVEMRRGYERMPGRRGGGFDIAFLPLSFPEFCRAFGHEPLEGSLMEILGDESVFGIFEAESLARKEHYIQLLDSYLDWGGFPMVVAELLKKGAVGAETMEVYRSVMFSEFEKQRRSVPQFMSLMRKLYGVLGAPVSYNALTQDTGCRSNAVVQDYLGIFGGAFLGFEVPCIDLAHRRPFPKREKKFYAIDPILWKITAENAGLPPAQKAALAEQATAVHLARALADRWSTLGTLEGLYYFRSRKGNEVDFVFLNRPEDEPFGTEVKYQAGVSGWDEQSISKGIGRGVLVTKDAFKWGKICHIPLWAFLLVRCGGL